MIKNILKILFCAVLVFLPVLSVNADENLDIAAVNINKPDVSFEVKTDEIDKDNFSSITLDNESLELIDAKEFDYDAFSVCCYVMIDVSGSMTQSNLDALKSKLIDFSKGFDENDKFVMYAVGENKKELLKGNETADTRASAIQSLRVTDDNSYIYKYMNDIYNDAITVSDYDRKFILVLSDGVNWSTQTSFETVNSNFSKQALPVYALISNNGFYSSNTNESVSQFKDLAMHSGGGYADFTDGNGEEKFDDIVNAINHISIVRCRAKNNAVDTSLSKHILSFDYDGKNSCAENVDASQYQSDSVLPKVEQITFKENAFIITFSESIAYDENKIAVSKKDIPFTVSSTKYNNDTYELFLYVKEDVYSGEYKFDLSAITDNSVEKNGLAQATITENIKASSIIVKAFKTIWWIIPIVVFLVLLFLMLLFLKKKKNVKKIRQLFETQVEEETVEQKFTRVVKEQNIISLNSNKKKIDLYIENASDKKKISVMVENSLIVGRSKQCDLMINDRKMSRQHFAIEVIDEKFAILDLETTNGTFVNGVKLTDSKYPLKANDKIFAGTTEITVVY